MSAHDLVGLVLAALIAACLIWIAFLFATGQHRRPTTRHRRRRRR